MGALDYISYPIIEEELKYRVQQALHCQNLIEIQETDRHEELSNKFCIQHNNLVKSEYLLVEKTVDYLNSRLDKEVKLSDITREMGTNKDKLYQVFKTYFKTTVLSWLREQRMLQAANLLINTPYSITRISREVGYPDSNHFSTAFKRTFNVSPRRYRNDFIKKE